MVVIGLEIGGIYGVEFEDIDLINHTQKIDVNFQSNIGKKLIGFFYTILTHPV
jgi:hypothetical protein